MNMNPAEDWLALTENYRSMSDGQLCELAAEIADLTPTAQQVLRDELRLRKLSDLQSAGRVRTPREESAAPDGDGGPVEYTWKTLLCECDTEQQAGQYAEMLRRAGIESWIEGPRTYAQSSGSEHAGLDLGSQRVLVAADQLDEAKLIISHPVPFDIVEEWQMTAPAYELPLCPRCGSADPVLESVEPANEWRCESCGAEWVEEGPGDAPEG